MKTKWIALGSAFLFILLVLLFCRKPETSRMVIKYQENIGKKVKVRSGDKVFESKIDEIEWDIDQHIYLIDGTWYCESEVEILT